MDGFCRLAVATIVEEEIGRYGDSGDWNRHDVVVVVVVVVKLFVCSSLPIVAVVVEEIGLPIKKHKGETLLMRQDGDSLLETGTGIIPW